MAGRSGPDEPAIDRPLFLVGCARSGSTLLYDVLCGHEDLAWFSNYTDRWPSRPELARLSVLYPWARRRGLDVRGVPRPAEGYRIYDRGSTRTPEDDNRPLDGDDAGPQERVYLRSVISAHLRHQGAGRFINKNTRNARRLLFLDRMFPDALYLHLFRDPRPAVSSLLRVAFWPQLRLWWRDDRTTPALVADGHHPEVLAAELWHHEVSRCGEDAARLGSDRVLAVRYEDLVLHPRTTVARVLEFAGLVWDADFEAVFSTFTFIAETSRYRRLLSGAQIGRIDEVTGDLAATLGYPPDR